MDRDLIIQSLKSACGNKQMRFQVIEQNSKLHIYINRQADYNPDYPRLTDLITNTIASLALESLKGIWLYSRKLGEIEPDWQVFVEFPLETDLKTQVDTIATDKQIVRDHSLNDTGLLQSTGMVHEKPLAEEPIETFVGEKLEAINADLKVEVNSLAAYCFVKNKKILTGDIIPPNKEIIRLVKFFHHLSDNNQHTILPLLEEYFQTKKTPNTENLAIALQKWLKQITDLNEDHRRTLAIWLSRYCFDSSGTIDEFKAIAQKETEQAEAAQKSKRSSTEYSFTPANANFAANKTKNIKNAQSDELTAKKFQLPPLVQQLVIPIIWTLFTVILVCLGVYTNQSQRNTVEQIPALCQTTIGSPNYCRLGINLAGEKAIAPLLSRNIFPLTKVTETVADYGCQRYANLKAEALTNLDPEDNPVLSSHGEKIFPNIYVVQALQKNAKRSGNVRVGCVYTTGAGERSPTTLKSDVIPNNWPNEYYQKGETKSNLAFGIYTNPINLALYTLFSAIGIAIVSKLNLGIAVTKRPETIYLVALILGIVQLIAVNLPALNIIASITLPVVTILAISQFVKDFKINWNYGYLSVAAGIGAIVAVQFLLYGISLKLINGIF